ncbi:helix-turn-helix domain-containing protein [Cupriavidus pinatubonensis]|uniref:helix-turn-helix domain-containing protein n=1 Tax=Cupriavidus pinatubonensis TaxID=248026 RepID=UPI001F2D7936|nr:MULTISPECIES: helix-turn-helix domain-containing protein [Cupriavidus]
MRTGLHITSRQVLATLIRFSLSKTDPTALAFLKKATIAEHLAISEATIYRALGILERAGLIEREPQQRSRANLRVVTRVRKARDEEARAASARSALVQ